MVSCINCFFVCRKENSGVDICPETIQLRRMRKRTGDRTMNKDDLILQVMTQVLSLDEGEAVIFLRDINLPVDHHIKGCARRTIRC